MLYLWIVNFLFSLAVITPLLIFLDNEFSRSLITSRLNRGLDLLLLGDLVHKYRIIFPGAWAWILVTGFLFIVLSIFLKGGIIGTIVGGGENISFSDFLSECGKYFSRFLRVFGISLMAYVFLLWLFHGFLSFPFRFWIQNASNEWPYIILDLAKLFSAFVLFTIVRMFFDYAQIRLAVEGSQKAVRAILLNVSFIGKRLVKAWTLYLLAGIAVVLFSLIYIGARKILPENGVFWFVFFLFQQAYVFSLIWAKILIAGTEFRFYTETAMLPENK